MKKIFATLVIIVALIISGGEQVFRAQELAVDAPPAGSQYTDGNKKILNIGGSYIHSVKKGDTVWGVIMRENQTDPNYYNYYLQEFIRLNPQIKDVNKIEVGDKLLIPDIVHKRAPKPVKPKEEPKVTLDIQKEEPKKELPKPQEPPLTKPKKAEPEKLKEESKKEKPAEDKKKKEPRAAAEKPKEAEKKEDPNVEKPKSAIVEKKEEVKKDKPEEKAPIASAGVKEVSPASIDAGTDSISGSGGKQIATAVIDSSLEAALQDVSSRVVTSGVTFFPLQTGEMLKLDNSATPLVYTGNNKVVLDYGNKISPEVEDYVKSKFKFYDFVNVDENDSQKVVVGKVLKSSGYYSVRENKDIKIGKNVKLVIRYDWLVEKTAESFGDGDVKLVKVQVNQEDKVPDYIKEYLEKFGFFVSEVKAHDGGVAKVPAQRLGRIISLGDETLPKKIVKNLLDALGITAKEGAALKFKDEKETFFKTDYYFEASGAAYIINLNESSDSAKELVAKHGLTLLELDATGDGAEIMKKIFNLLQKDYNYATFRLLGEEGSTPFLDVEIKGFFIGDKALIDAMDGKRSYIALPSFDGAVFITQYKIPSTIGRLLTDHGYKVIER